MRFEVLKVMDMGQGEKLYRVYGPYKTKNGAMNRAKKEAALYNSKNVTFKIVDMKGCV